MRELSRALTQLLGGLISLDDSVAAPKGDPPTRGGQVIPPVPALASSGFVTEPLKGEAGYRDLDNRYG